MAKPCVHLNDNYIRRAIEIIDRIGGVYCSDETTCVSCYFGGSLNSYSFQKHLLDEEHYICLRTQPPYELFCSYCGDFQYAEEFDKHLGKHRPQQTPAKLHVDKERAVIMYKGICNMGSTCFMGSVLQVFIHNESLRKHMLMLPHPCTKSSGAEHASSTDAAVGFSCIACEMGNLCIEAESKPR